MGDDDTARRRKMLHMNVQLTDATSRIISGKTDEANLAANMPQKGKSQTDIRCRRKEEKDDKHSRIRRRQAFKDKHSKNSNTTSIRNKKKKDTQMMSFKEML
ncbi:MAG: hypothetical protein J5884_01545 [Paludibacteraceae bacterium]|nr:hypothetical protein [Paludibacteraceae bacterium]